MKNVIKRLHCPAAAVVAGLVSFAGSSEAHQQWLSPNFFLKSGESAWVSFDHTFSDQRFQPDSGPGSYYSWWVVSPDGIRRNVPNLFLGRTRTVGEVELTDAGTYRIEAVEDLMPWTQIKVDGEDTWQPGVRADFDGFEIVRSNIYFNKSVSYVTLESISQSLLAGSGDPLEILFEDHPNDLQAGKKIRLRVLASGQSLTGQEVRVFSEQTEGHDASATCSTDANGICEIEMASPGRYLLETNTEGDNPEGSATDGYRHGYTVMIELKPADNAPETD